jgi:DNA-binding NarL/FixJ family response regulator
MGGRPAEGHIQTDAGTLLPSTRVEEGGGTTCALGKGVALELVALQQDHLVGPPSSAWLREVHRDERTSSWSPVDVWSNLVAGRLALTKHFSFEERAFLVARDSSTEEQHALSARESEVLSHLLIGQSQKWMGYELGLSASTVATHIARAFAKLGVAPSVNGVPLALILICQGAREAIRLSDPQITTSTLGGERYVIASVARPSETHLSDLTTAERAIALALVDGLSKFDIARARSTSVHTIGRQISSVFAKLNVKGRFDLICRMGQ